MAVSEGGSDTELHRQVLICPLTRCPFQQRCLTVPDGLLGPATFFYKLGNFFGY